MRKGIGVVLLTVSNLVWACPDYLDSDLRKLHSSDSVNLCEQYGGQPMLIVNTASRCGYTGQFEGLEDLHQEYKDDGLAVVGFASNDFNQEADSEEEAANVCRINYGVTFTMIAPSAVTGSEANAVFAALAEQAEAPRWNFHKYVLNAHGEVVANFPSQVRPSDESLRNALEAAIAGE